MSKLCLSVFLQKPSKAVADLDLPPHMLNKPAAAASGASSKPPLSQQSSTSASHKTTVLPIPMTGPPSSSKSKKTHDQSPGKAGAKPTEEESPASSRASTPSGKGKQRTQEGRAVSGRLDQPPMSSPTPARKVVPIKLDRGPRQTEQQAGSSRQSSGATQNAATTNDAQVQYEHHCKQPNAPIPCVACCAENCALLLLQQQAWGRQSSQSEQSVYQHMHGPA